MFDATRAGFTDSARQAFRIFLWSAAIDYERSPASAGDDYGSRFNTSFPPRAAAGAALPWMHGDVPELTGLAAFVNAAGRNALDRSEQPDCQYAGR